MPDPSLLYTPPRPGVLDELRALLPEAEVSTGKRKVQLRWRTTRLLKAFVVSVVEDEDLIPMVATWYRAWDLRVGDEGVAAMVGFNLSLAEVEVLLRRLRQVAAATAAG